MTFNSIKFITDAPRILLIAIISFYQATISPDRGFFVRWAFPNGFCRFHPTCSEYGKRAVRKFGVILGLRKVIWRVLRCNPWSRGGIDNP